MYRRVSSSEKRRWSTNRKYIIESQGYFSFRWYFVGDSKTLEYTSHSFQEGDRQRFRVKARNVAADSDPSDPTQYIYIK